MTRKRLDELGALQRQVMEVLWSHSAATVHEVLAHLGGDPAPAYTTILSVLQKLEKAGWVTHRKDGRSHIYSPHESRDQAGRSALRTFVDRVFAGDSSAALQHLLDDERLDAADIDALHTLIERRRAREEGRTDDVAH